jgi:hypothetical protein
MSARSLVQSAKRPADTRSEFTLHFGGVSAHLPSNLMSNFDSDGSTSNEWEDRGDLVWNEFDWERYLREQDESIRRYQGFYEASKGKSERVDLVAEQMGWDIADWTDDIDDTTDDDDEDEEDDDGEQADEGDVYTLHKNPIFIATKAIALSLQQSWQLTAASSGSAVTPSLAVAVLSSLHRGEEQAVQAIHALDFGDYAMAISLFKRALGVLNSSLALLNGDEVTKHPALTDFREVALPGLFDLREIWLRVINECRDELERSTDEEA